MPTLVNLCENCGEPCEVLEEDFGIGAYEFWGACGNHVDIREVSECCGAAVKERTLDEGDDS